MDQLKKDISTVIVKNYSPEAVEEFFKSYDYFRIFELVHNNEDEMDENTMYQFIGFMTSIFRLRKYAEVFLFSQDEKQKQLLAYIMQNPSDDIRQLIAIAVSHHIPLMTDVLHNCDDKTFEEYLGALFIQLNDESTKVGLKVSNVLQQIGKESKRYDYSLLKKEVFLNLVEKGLKDANSVTLMRYIDLIVELTNYDQNVFVFFKEKGIMNHIVEAYKTDDILLKLSIVEVIPKMGDSEWNSKFINENLVSKGMSLEFFDDLSDYYVRKNIGSLIAKLISRGILPMDKKTKEGFVKVLRLWFNSGMKEEAYGALDIVANLVLRNSGFEIIMQNHDILTPLFVTSHSTDSTLKRKFLHVLAEIFNQEVQTKDDQLLRRCWALFGEIPLVAQKKLQINELNLEKFDSSYEYLFKILYQPFVELEIEALFVLRKLIEFEWAILDLAKNEKTLKYFFEHIAKGTELLNLKRQIIQTLPGIIDKLNTKDIYLLEFKNKLVSASKKNLPTSQNQMSYETETL